MAFPRACSAFACIRAPDVCLDVAAIQIGLKATGAGLAGFVHVAWVGSRRS